MAINMYKYPTKQDYITAIQQNRHALSRLSRYYPRVDISDDDQVSWYITDLSYALLNSVLFGPDIKVYKIDGFLQEAIAHANENKVGLTCPIVLGYQSEKLISCLTKFGFTSRGHGPGMALDLSKLNADLSNPEKVKVRNVEDIEALYTWSHVVTLGYGYPSQVKDDIVKFFPSIKFTERKELKLYVAYLDNEPVAASALLLADNVAGIYFVATFQRRDVGELATKFR